MNKGSRIMLLGVAGISTILVMGGALPKKFDMLADPIVLAQSDDYSPVCETPYGYCYMDGMLLIGSPCYCIRGDGTADEGYVVPE